MTKYILNKKQSCSNIGDTTRNRCYKDILVSEGKKISLLVACTFLFLLISLKSYALLGDIHAPLRCDETYKIDNLCFPSSAILQPDGRCVCPTGGCTNCPTDSTGTIEDYYCQYPINILSTVSNRGLNIGFDATVTLHYEELFFPNSCGNRHRSGFSCESFMLLSAPAIAAAAMAGPLALPALMISLGAYCAARSGDNEEGWSSSNRLNVLFDNPEGPAPDNYDSTPGQIVTEAFQSSAKAINPNRYYGIQPRLEFTNIGGVITPVVKFYFTQADKLDVWQLLFPNTGSGSTSTDYFDFAQRSFPRGDNWETPLAGIGVSAVWRSIKLCDTYGNPGHSSSDGVDCENTSYFQGLLVDQNDSSKGFKIPPPPAEPFFPSELDLFQGGSFRMLDPPAITWQLAAPPASTFTNPVINVTFTDSLDVTNNSSATVNILEKSVIHTHQSRWRYQLYSKIENNDNVINQKKICLYACPLAKSGAVCRDDAAVPTTGLSIDDLLSNADANIKNAAKNEFIVAYNDLDNCTTLPEITGAASISITGLGIGSTYDDPKISVAITQEGVSTETRIYSIMNKQEIHDTVNMIENTTTSYLHNYNAKPLFKPQISSIRQDLDLGVVQNATGPACTSNSNCPTGYRCCAPVCNDDSSSCTIPTTCADSFCTAEGKLCQLYNYIEHASFGSYLQTCNTAGTVTATLNSLSEDAKSFICLHNVYPTNTLPKLHPYNVDSDIISNTYSDDPVFSGANRNLCVPAPKKIESFSYVMVDDNKANPISDVSVTYRKPKPFLTYEDDDFTVLSSSDEGVLMSDQIITALDDYTGPAPSAANLVETVRYDYHNNLRFTYENSNGIYSISLEKYNYATGTWYTPLVTGVDGSGRIVNRDTGSYTANLNYCPAGLLPGVPFSNMPRTPANASNVVGSCASSCVAGSGCVDPQANCDAYGVWQAPIEGFCVNACPAKTVSIANGTISIPETVSSSSGDVAVTITGSCASGYGGSITASDSCQSDGTWKNDGSETTTGSCAQIPCTTSDISVTHRGGWVYNYTVPGNMYVGDSKNIACDGTFKYRDHHPNGHIQDSYFSSTGGKTVTVTCNADQTLSAAAHTCDRECYVWDHGYHVMQHDTSISVNSGRCGLWGSGREYRDYYCDDGGLRHSTRCEFSFWY